MQLINTDKIEPFIPKWHIEIVRERLVCNEKPIDFNKAIEDVEYFLSSYDKIKAPHSHK